MPDHPDHAGVQALRRQRRLQPRLERGLRVRHLGLVADQGRGRLRQRDLQGPLGERLQVARASSRPVSSCRLPICVGVEHPSFRFFARRTSGTWGVLNVKLRWTGSNGQTNDTVVGSLSGDPYKSWLASPSLPLATTLPLWQSGQSLSVRLVFDPEDFGGAWSIDDVYVDPYRR